MSAPIGRDTALETVMLKTLQWLFLSLTVAIGACTDERTIVVGGSGGGGGGEGGGGGGGSFCSGFEVICIIYRSDPGTLVTAADVDAALDTGDACQSCTDGQVCDDGICR